MSTSPTETSRPWWRYGHVWLVLAGPLAVVIAGLVTFGIAVSGADALVSEDYYQRGLDINRSQEGGNASLAPALKARNHAATGVVPATPVAPRP
ncbi:MAG: nitrogen fixation protein FixH [Rhodoferax sp.]|nr:nitrogen fixation protein FixH [Rhodoferax sp.]